MSVTEIKLIKVRPKNLYEAWPMTIKFVISDVDIVGNFGKDCGLDEKCMFAKNQYVGEYV